MHVPAQISVTLNKNTVPGDRNAFAPGGVRIGTPALTSRGFTVKDFEQVAEFLHRGLQIALDIQKTTNAKNVAEFVVGIEGRADIAALKEEVEKFALSFPIPGFHGSAVTCT
jgi:glycine hydroxymethyltransferase